ncbi:Muskelin N-terminus-domain-containing protein [Mycena belliarum]|uniref:Muskelin N-terminus-domain-containing protein n=1 Tax=Mycena belliarum TaxID=1033014 RepID=A0AAD6TTN3_9AGAR|nr:Muskelin N-terminus-domain-containing protein [Mycena belliae]
MATASVPLVYTIVASTPHSGPYHAENILEDNPTEQASRWSGGPVPETGTPQWLLLRIETLAVVQSITFGKFSSGHPCNMKDFKVLAGPSEDSLVEVLHASLKNDTHPEHFDLKHVNEQGIMTPFRYIKIMPLSSHGNSFHISIWYVALRGIKDEVVVEEVRIKYEQYRETTAMRHVLKHLRQRRFLTEYKSVLSRCGLQVEDPLVTELHENLILKGDWAKVEQTVLRMSQTDLFDEYRNSKQCHGLWKRLLGKDANGDVPAPRGGHAMCIDHVGGTIYLFGGWNGKNSLDDFWAYDILQEKWRVLSYHTSVEKDAPGARSCHKMVFDTKTGNIYMLGRLNDVDAARLDTTTPSTDAPTAKPGYEFYRYKTRGSSAGKWEILSIDPPAPHAPPLVYDHQMVIDCEAQIIYVYGGRVIDGDWGNTKFAGLYSYNIRLVKWHHLQTSPKLDANFSGGIIPARSGHSMVLDDRTRTLYIFGGKIKDSAHYDMYAYDIATRTTRQLFSNLQRDCGFEASFTHRAVIAPQLQEIYVFSGLAVSAEQSPVIPYDSATRIFRYGQPPGKWDVVLPAPGDEAGAASPDEPPSRYAHQVVYDPTTRTIFMHGGNAGNGVTKGEDENAMDVGDSAGVSARLDDFWQMTLLRSPPEDVVRRATLQIRKQQFREMCEDVSPAKALHFLQTAVFKAVDHSDEEETEAYRGLLSYLLAPSPKLSSHPHLKTPSSSSEHEDSPPRKRSRPNTPEDSEMGSPQALEVRPPAAKIPPFDVQYVKETEDPEETRGGATAMSTGRFQQRNALFEGLLEFVSVDAKQPSGSLLGALAGSPGASTA